MLVNAAVHPINTLKIIPSDTSEFLRRHKIQGSYVGGWGTSCAGLEGQTEVADEKIGGIDDKKAAVRTAARIKYSNVPGENGLRAGSKWKGETNRHDPGAKRLERQEMIREKNVTITVFHLTLFFLSPTLKCRSHYRKKTPNTVPGEKLYDYCIIIVSAAYKCFYRSNSDHITLKSQGSKCRQSFFGFVFFLVLFLFLTKKHKVSGTWTCFTARKTIRYNIHNPWGIFSAWPFV